MNGFPIKSATACQLKWTWATIFLVDGSTANCHRNGRHIVPIEDFQNFNNTPTKLEHRRAMARGEWPEDNGCWHCKNVEEAGGTSDRMYHQHPDMVSWNPVEMYTDPTALSVTPKVVEAFINNTCNLKCVYCSPSLSSSIQRENAQFGGFRRSQTPSGKTVPVVEIQSFEPEHPNREKYVSEFFKWMHNNHKNVMNFQLLGGEPLLEPEFDQFLDFFNDHPSPHCGIVITTNLMVKEKVLQKQIDKLANLVEKKLIRYTFISGSIDGWGPCSEFTRAGLDLEVFKNNFEYCLHHPGIEKIGVNQTLTPLTIKETVPLMEKLHEWGTMTTKSLKFKNQLNTDTEKDFLHFKTWGGALFDADFTEIVKVMRKYNMQTADYMNGFHESIKNVERDQVQIDRFCIYFDELDRRRGTNWRQMFPWLAEQV